MTCSICSRNNKLKITVDALDEDLLMAGLQKIANRITLGLILAALIVGASMLMRIETNFTIFGYPGLAALFFLAASAGGVALAVPNPAQRSPLEIASSLDATRLDSAGSLHFASFA